MGCEKIINLQQEGGENILNLEREMNVGGAVKSVNGMTGDVVLTTSDLENTSDYQTGSEVESAISSAVGAEATIRANADTALGGRIDNLVTGLSDEITARQTADNSLQGQIDAITASSDVTDIVGTKAQLNNYDTSKLNDNDIIKVLQDESQNDETTYYRWSTATQSFSLIGEEGPYYTKAESNVLLQAKQDVLTAGTNINITNNVISATDTTYSAGNAITIDANNEISADIYPADYFTAEASMTETGSEVSFDDTLPANMSFDNLYGDSTQQTYTGKNLIDFGSGAYTSGGITATRDGNTVTVTGKRLSTVNYMFFTSGTINFGGVVPASTYTLSIASPVSKQLQVSLKDSDGNSVGLLVIPVGETSITGTISEDVYSFRAAIAPLSYDEEIDVVFQDIQLEAGSAPTAFEPYVGGVPAPNPQYPQDVHVVTGEQTVTVSDGTNSQSYTVDLGTIELCKLGDYQDYIYKSGDDWYVHKEVSKYTFDGTETWTSGVYGVNSWYLRGVLSFPYDTSKVQIISNLFRGVSNNDRNTGNNIIYTTDSNTFWIRNTSLSTLAQVQAATNGNYTYYALATPTDTQITDASLVNQLDLLDMARSYNGETNIVISASSTNLPAIAKVTAIKNSASGVVKELENAVTSAELDSRLGGLTLLPISQTDYDALSTKDPNTLYVITGA